MCYQTGFLVALCPPAPKSAAKGSELPDLLPEEETKDVEGRKQKVTPSKKTRKSPGEKKVRRYRNLSDDGDEEGELNGDEEEEEASAAATDAAPAVEKQGLVNRF